MLRILFSFCLLFLSACQKKEELGAYNDLLCDEEEPIEWDFPQKVILEEEGSEVVLFEEEMHWR